jgi:hypothetical protein
MLDGRDRSSAGERGDCAIPGKELFLRLQCQRPSQVFLRPVVVLVLSLPSQITHSLQRVRAISRLCCR